jgi:hypothetical protein
MKKRFNKLQEKFRTNMQRIAEKNKELQEIALGKKKMATKAIIALIPCEC